MDYALIIFVLTGALVDVASAQTRQFYFVSSPLNWTDAQSFCRQTYTDLATIENTADVNAVISTASHYTGKAWIGLYDELINSWRWSLNDSSFYGEGETEFRNWYTGQPNNLGGQQHCVELFTGSPYFGTWGDTQCSVEKPFVCYNGTANGTISFVKVDTPLNWTEAQRFCRENYVDLASIRNQTENSIITNLANGSFVWIGLHREKLWSDGSTSLFRHWAVGQPNLSGEECVTTSFNDSGRWSDDNCTFNFSFICFKTIPPNTDSFRSAGQDETSITLQWNEVNNNVSFILQFNGTEINITAPVGGGPVTHTVSSLTAGTKYTFTLFSVFENVRSSGVNLTAVTAPPNTDSFRSAGQDETSITLQWNEVNNNVSFILQFNGTEINITAPVGGGPVTHTVSSLTAGTKYTFTLFSVFENIRSSGVNLTAVTAPPNTDSFRSAGQNETSITLQWNEVNNNVSFILQFNGTEINITAPVGGGPVTHTVSSLTAGTKHTFTLFSVFENVRSSGVNLTAVTAPPNTDSFRSAGQNETSITLQWNEVNNNVSFILQFNGTEINITAPVGGGPVTHTVSSLTAGTEYTFTLFSVFENVRSSGVNLTAVTAPPNTDSFRSAGQNETSITLQWNTVNNNVSFILQFNGTEINITAPVEGGPVTHTVSSLTAGTEYTFTLFSVFENVRSSGVNLTAVTAPPNTDSFRSAGQNETSITLQWNEVNNNVSFILQFNGTQTNISAPVGGGPVIHTVSSLTAGTKYTFTLFSVFENVRSSGVNLTAVTAPPNKDSFRSVRQNETSITLQWNEVNNNNVSFILQFNGTEINITAPVGGGPVTHTVSSLTAGTEYTFTLFSVFENVRSSGVNLTAVTAPPNTDSFRSAGQNETSITLQWNEVNNNVSFILQFNGTEINITAPVGGGPVTHTVSSLTAGTKYTFTLFSVFENVRSSGVNLTAVTAPPNTDSFRSAGQNETSITLQWNEVNNNVSFILQFNGTEINITAPVGGGPVTHTVSSLTAGTEYTFTLFSVFENVRSSGVNLTTVTAPPNKDSFRSVRQNETSITLQWNEVNNNNVSFILQFNGTEINITAPVGGGPVTHTVSSLTAGTEYTFTLFSVFENVRSSGVNLTAVTAPPNTDSFRSAGQNETSITLQWNEVNNNVSFILQFNGTEINITAPVGGGPVTHTVSSLTAGTKYTFTLFSVFENVRSSGVNLTAVTVPPNTDSFRSAGQNETSITLQWNEVNNNVSFILQFNGTEINITAPVGGGPVTHTVSSLTAGTKYTFTLFSVFENVRSSGVNLTAFTAPPNTDSFRSAGQNETSITLQWNEVNNNISFILQFNETQINISAPVGGGPVTHTVSSLTAGTKYTFTLFSVFENVRSSGVNLTAVTAPPNTDSFRSAGQNETSITLQWNEVNNNVSFILQFNGTEINITAPVGGGPVTHTVSSLTAGTEYTFTLFSVFENIRSSGVNLTAVTATLNTDSFRSAGQNETSITLQWNNFNYNVSFILQFNGTEINITAPVGGGPVTHTVSSLTAGTEYTFTLFSVFENVRSSGVNLTAVTAPPNADSFRSAGQNETSITLQWNKVNNNVSFILQFNGTQTNISAPVGGGPVTHTVSSLTAGTEYTFTLFSVFENVRSSGVNLTAVTAPPNTDSFRSAGQNETSITLQWNEVNNNVSFILQFNGTEINITAPVGGGPVTHTVSSLTAGTEYTFTLFSVFENVRSSGVNITAVTVPPNAISFRSTGQEETSITLQWNKVNNNVGFILQFNGTEINITAPVGGGPVTHTVSSLTAGTEYTFTLFSVFENFESSGVNLTAVTAPPNTDSFRSTGQNETSITLQWNKVNNNVSFILQFNGTEINITAPVGGGPVTHTVSSLTAGTKYTFTLFSVFENVRSSGVNLTAVTEPYYVVGLKIRMRSSTQASTQVSDSDIQILLEELFRQTGLSPQFSFMVKSAMRPVEER
ncbi:tenascin-X-like isoform X5 [Sparus aurata]|uniref:tenascin-X-like isoform X5 n=1 Tax=Sparus aurata TaxID=8175 RepID=UPI0011C1092F|nr:tenascin-X-like isoform X5 [Sparus aurata]